MRRAVAFGLFAAGLICPAGPARAFGIGSANASLEWATRWDAAPRTVYGEERSLDGGLRYSLQGGSYEAFRDTFDWGNNVPSVTTFQDAVESAFGQWLRTDPATGLGTDLAFAADFATDVGWGYGGGAEIDLFASNDGYWWDPGQDGGVTAEASVDVDSTNHSITLTSGTAGYAGSAIAGADILFNSNVTWTLYRFETTLTHEIGHALGLADVDIYSGPEGLFIDDNYDGTNGTTARDTLMNSFASLIDPYDPASSPLGLYHVADGNPGFDSNGVTILMESATDFLLWISDQKLRNDDFAGRQFLYPFVVPEPASLPLVALGLAALAARRRTR